MDVTAGYGWGPVRVGVDLPIYLWTAGTEGGQAGLGDAALDGKLRLLDRDEAPLGLAFSARLGLPTNTTTAALGGGGAQGELAFVADRQMGDFVLGGNLGTRLLPTTVLENTTWDDQLLFRLGGSWARTDTSGLSLELAGNSTFKDFGQKAATPIETILGGWFHPGGGNMVVRGGLGTGITQGIGTPRMRALLALAWEPPTDKDTDLDGIMDSSDACPAVPEDKDGWEDTDGCAEPTQVTVKVVDPAGVEIAPATLNFPGQAAGSHATLKLEPGTVTVKATAPQYQTLDVSVDVPSGPPVERTVVLKPFGNLNIIVVDEKNILLDATIVVSTQGQAEQARTGVTAQYTLPAGTWRVLVRKEGRGPKVLDVNLDWAVTDTVTVMLTAPKAVVKKNRIELKDSVYFDTNADTIKPESFDLLNEVAQILQEHPEITRIRIEGHTDSRGSDSFNLDLSKRRAASVLKYLVASHLSA